MKLPKELAAFVAEENEFIVRRIKMQFGRAPMADELIDLTRWSHVVRLRDLLELRLEGEALTQDGELPKYIWQAEERRLNKVLKQLEAHECPSPKSTFSKDSTEPSKKSRRSTPRAATTSAGGRSKKA